MTDDERIQWQQEQQQIDLAVAEACREQGIQPVTGGDLKRLEHSELTFVIASLKGSLWGQLCRLDNNDVIQAGVKAETLLRKAVDRQLVVTADV